MKISFYTTCMNRLHHISNTLGSNIAEASKYGAEVVLLNYGSKDGLDEWIKKNWESLSTYVNSGNFNYYHTTEPEYFLHSHAKNIAAKLGSGDILCNIDADNYICAGFTEFLLNAFLEDGICVLSNPADAEGNYGCCGKIAMTRRDFYSINGYDEELEGWGWEDLNFQFRARALNNLKIVPCPMIFNKTIPHSTDERVANCVTKDVRLSESEGIKKTHWVRDNGVFVANIGEQWGKSTVVKNFDQTLFI